MARADRRYTEGLMARLQRTVPNTEGRVWHLEQGSQTYGRMWRVSERDTTTGGLYHDIARGVSESALQDNLGAFLDGYDAAQREYEQHGMRYDGSIR
jgi:hypothetical protein